MNQCAQTGKHTAVASKTCWGWVVLGGHMPKSPLRCCPKGCLVCARGGPVGWGYLVTTSGHFSYFIIASYFFLQQTVIFYLYSVAFFGKLFALYVLAYSMVYCLSFFSEFWLSLVNYHLFQQPFIYFLMGVSFSSADSPTLPAFPLQELLSLISFIQ